MLTSDGAHLVDFFFYFSGMINKASEQWKKFPQGRFSVVCLLSRVG